MPDILQSVRNVVKHLPGQHTQRRHAGSRGGTGDVRVHPSMDPAFEELKSNNRPATDGDLVEHGTRVQVDTGVRGRREGYYRYRTQSAAMEAMGRKYVVRTFYGGAPIESAYSLGNIRVAGD